jgi:hypothetical protein
MKLPTLQLSSFSRYFIPLRSLFSNTLSLLCSSLTDKCTLLIHLSIYNNDLYVFVSTLLMISLSYTYFFHVCDHVLLPLDNSTHGSPHIHWLYDV